MTTLTKAAIWNADPKARRFDSLRDLSIAALERAKGLHLGAETPARDWLFLARGGEIVTDAGAAFTSRAFRQACGFAQAPASYLQRLPADLAARCLTHGWTAQDDLDAIRRPFYGPNNQIEAIVSDRFGPLHHIDALRTIAPVVKDQGLVAAHCKWEGYEDAKALYLKGPRMFCFVMDDDAAVEGPGGVNLRRGLWIENDDSGGGSAKIATFLFSHLCCNHYVWNSSAYNERRTVHLGEKVGERFQVMCQDARTWLEEFDARPLHKMAEVRFASPEEALDRIYSNRKIKVLKRDLEDAIDFIQTPDGPTQAGTGDTDPLSLWGIYSALTFRSQQFGPEVRVEKDLAASTLMELAR